AGGDAADEFFSGEVASIGQVLGDGDDRRNVVSRVGVVRGQEGVVVVQFPHRYAVGPRRPFGAHALGLFETENCGAGGVGVGLRLGAGCDRGAAGEGGCRHGGVVDHTVDDHVGDLVGHLHRVGGHFSDLPGELILA